MKRPFIILLLILCCGMGCASAEMRREGIPTRRSSWIGVPLAIITGPIYAGSGHRYAGDPETGADLWDKHWKSVVYPVLWPFLGAAHLSNPDNASLGATFDEATSITLVSPILLIGTWLYDVFKTPSAVRQHNRMVDRMWEAKEAMDEARFPASIRLGSIHPGETLDRSLGVRDRLPPDVELVFSMDPLEGPVELSPTLRPSASGELFVSIPVPPETPAGVYTSTLRYAPADVAVTERALPVQIRVLELEVSLRLLGEVLDLSAAGTGWVRGLAEFVYETPLPGVCEIIAGSLKGDDSQEIHPAFDVRLSPREEWDGKTLEPNKTYRLEVAVYVSPDLPDGLYQGNLEIRAAPSGQPKAVTLYPINLTLKR